jgi:ATP-dependent 26S proteasome regulatory subunit
LRRPGRFDEIVEFHPLTKDQRKTILVTYAKEFGVKYTDREFNKLAALTDNMTGAYLKEIALRASVVPFVPMCAQVDQMKRVCNMADEENDGEEEEVKKRKRRKSSRRRSANEPATPKQARRIR